MAEQQSDSDNESSMVSLRVFDVEMGNILINFCRLKIDEMCEN
jgi:hypothetical protein